MDLEQVRNQVAGIVAAEGRRVKCVFLGGEERDMISCKGDKE